MANIAPFQSWRYTEAAGRLDDLVTQPYDKISPEMQARYLTANPHNLVRIILGEKFETDNETENVYTRAAKHLNDWCASGILGNDQEPAIYSYRQEFIVPDTGERLMRKGFIGLGAVEDYKDGTVYRHEQTLSGPRKDRRDLLEATRAHFGQIFMLYKDPERRVDAVLDEAAHCQPVASVTDEYGTTHVLHRIADPAKIQAIQDAMADKKLLIADGHHRYETALQFRNDHPELQDARWVMMTFVNMNAPGLRILATHRVISGLPRFSAQTFLKRAGTRFRIYRFDTLGALTQAWEEPALSKIRIGIVYKGADGAYMLERDREAGELDVAVLHAELIEGALGISAEDVREQKYLKYVRGMDAATDPVAAGEAQISFLLQATTIEQVADCAFDGRCMPQKSTDFYPKLLSGLTIYRLEK
jgi:uncharacterized protein (DUF1015 family)